jgi:phosphoribosyl-AMP cyclohydrolase / phosphoribosyl-ATP pyrophosphohydrolase
MTDLQDLDWSKSDGLLPAIVQHADSGAVLMLGYMNRAALAATQSSGRVTFFSRSKGRLWMKGETSGHVLRVRSIAADCDRDTLLVLALPDGPACHVGTPTCWGDAAPQAAAQPLAFFAQLERIIAERKTQRPPDSYTVKLLDQGIRRMAQKVGEEGVEVALAAVAQSDEDLIGETADLIYHTWLLLVAKQIPLTRVTAELERRHADHGNA